MAGGAAGGKRSRGNPLVAIMTPALARVWRGLKEQQCKADLARCAAAIACYEAEKGRYPGSLADLFPGFLAAIPADPFAKSSTFVYRTEGAAATIYSLGVDGDDDGGLAFDADAGGDPTDSDLVWTLNRRP